VSNRDLDIGAVGVDTTAGQALHPDNVATVDRVRVTVMAVIE